MAGKGNPKGVTGNPNGRPKGIKNIVTQTVKERISSFVEGNFEEFETSFKNEKNNVIKMKIYLEAAKLVIPRPKDPEEEDDANRRHKELIDRLWPINPQK